MTTNQRRPLLCLLNLKHHWHYVSTDDGARFRRCTKCGKDDDGTGNGGNPSITGIAG